MSRAPSPTSPGADPTTSQRVRSRLPYYLMGLAIGCIVVGMIVLARTNSGGIPQSGDPDPARPPATAPAGPAAENPATPG